jgi:hypothetical protein
MPVPVHGSRTTVITLPAIHNISNQEIGRSMLEISLIPYGSRRTEHELHVMQTMPFQPASACRRRVCIELPLHFNRHDSFHT